MSLDGAVSGADPVCLNLLGQIIQVSNAFHEPGSFFNYRSPGSPDDRFAAAGRGNRQKLPEGQQVFMMKPFIAKKIESFDPFRESNMILAISISLSTLNTLFIFISYFG